MIIGIVGNYRKDDFYDIINTISDNFIDLEGGPKFIISDDYKLLDNLNTICNDISKYSEERILSDTKKRESLLHL